MGSYGRERQLGFPAGGRGSKDHRDPNHISKTVLSTVHFGPALPSPWRSRENGIRGDTPNIGGHMGGFLQWREWKSLQAGEPEALEDLAGVGWPAPHIRTSQRKIRGTVHSGQLFRPKRTEFITPQPLQSLFSWAEFMTEQQVKPKGRSRKAEPSYPSLFDWALSLEQKREAQAARP